MEKLKTIKALPDFLLWAEFRDGTETLYDVKRLIDEMPVFKDLQTIPGLFEQVKVDTGGYGISWNDDLDLDAAELKANGTILKDAPQLTGGNHCPMCGQMIRRHSTVQALASRANLTKRKSKGGRPIDPNSKRQKLLAQKQFS